jgi:hypothetical protein
MRNVEDLRGKNMMNDEVVRENGRGVVEVREMCDHMIKRLKRLIT